MRYNRRNMQNIKKWKRILNIFLVLVLLFVSKDIIVNKFFNKTMVTVPSVVNLEKKEAIKILRKANLDYNFISSRSNQVPFNYVYSQSPEANEKVKMNRAIKLYVNDEEGASLPDLRNLPLVEAMAMLKEKNIEVIRVDYISTNLEEDKVLASYPKEGSLIKYGEKLALLVSTQKLVKDNVMPNVIGLNLLDAEKILLDLKLNVTDVIGVKGRDIPENTVIRTEPLPDTELSKDTEIKIYVSVPKNDETPENLKLNQQYIDNIIKKALEEKNESN
ncbi:PASTA domain-containing protein [Oceanivirga salmonicida]|uniref:PASTA domain-containing protein n=1 Tax=Oceanivirga salmonicida TaxID=1769291 RepID=UPI00082A12E0|nr:PASTA domain-containing protein [Oceanivirga salmonicida]